MWFLEGDPHSLPARGPGAALLLGKSPAPLPALPAGLSSPQVPPSLARTGGEHLLLGEPQSRQPLWAASGKAVLFGLRSRGFETPSSLFILVTLGE